MNSKYQIVKGFRDILPPESSLFQMAEKEARKVFACFGFREIMLPVVEYLELFARSIGDTTDIVEKEMFVIPDKKGRSLALRPEATAGAVRAYIEGLAGKGPQKLYYFGPMFRYERPQKGRYRQFWQVGAEAIGFPGPGADAELVAMLNQYFRSFGLDGIELKLNSLGCKNCRPAYHEALVKYLESRRETLCEDCKRRLDRNPLRVLDCKNPTCIELAKAAPSPIDFLCADCAAHFHGLKKALDTLSIPYHLDPHLVRGLDYYTRTVFEFQAPTGLGSQNAIAAGGRYDDLVEELGGPATPAIGFAMGVERLVILLEQKIEAKKISAGPELFLVFAGERAFHFAFKLLFALRKSGVAAEMAIDEPDKSLRGQLKLADKAGAKMAMIIGDDELTTRSMNIKLLETGSELKLPLESLREMANIDWEEMKQHLSSAGFAFVSRDYEKALVENQSLFTIMKVYFDAVKNQEV